MNNLTKRSMALFLLFPLFFANCALISHEDEVSLLRQPKVNHRATTQSSDWVSFGADQYKGPMKGNRPHGQGEYRWRNGNRYKGGFKLGIRQGQGLWTFKSGMSYEGSFHKDIPHGKGILIFKDQSVFEGQFEKGYIRGKGILKSSDGYQMLGEFGRTDGEHWTLKGSIRNKDGRKWCSGSFNFKKTKRTSSYLRSYPSLISSKINYFQNNKCQLKPNGPLFIEKSVMYQKTAINKPAFWDALKMKIGWHVRAELQDGSILSGKSSKPDFHGAFTWTSSNGKDRSLQIWKDGKLLASSPQGDWTKALIEKAPCQVKNSNGRWLVVQGKCKNGFLNDANGTVILVNARYPKSLVGNFEEGQLKNGRFSTQRGQIQRTIVDTNNQIVLTVTQAENYEMAPNGTILRLGETVVVNGKQVFFKGNYTKSYGTGVCLYRGVYENCWLNQSGGRFDEVAQARQRARREESDRQEEAKRRRQIEQDRRSKLARLKRQEEQDLKNAEREYQQQLKDDKVAREKAERRARRRAEARASEESNNQMLRDVISGIKKYGNEITNDMKRNQENTMRAFKHDKRVQKRNERRAKREHEEKKQRILARNERRRQEDKERLSQRSQSSSRPRSSPSTFQTNARSYDRARASCKRTNDSWDNVNKRCLPKDKIVTYNINILPSACYGDGPYCKQSDEGFAVLPSTGSSGNAGNTGQGGNTDGSSGGTGTDSRYFPAGFDNHSGGGSGGSGSSGGSGGTQQNGASVKSGDRALAVSWQLKSGKWKAFGPIQGDLGVAEISEAKALSDVAGSKSNTSLLASNGKYRIHDLGRPLNSGDMNVYRYAMKSYQLDLSQWK